MPAISRTLQTRASTRALPTVLTALTVLTVLIACGGRSAGTADPSTATLGTMPLDSVYQIETTGSPPRDSTVTLIAGTPRVVLLDHGPPANVVFAEVRFDTAAFQASSGAEVRVTLRPRPGIYGLSVESSAPLREAHLTFKYAVHFLAPAAAHARYGNDIAVERALGIGRLESGAVTFLQTTRPAMDNLHAIIASAGTYLLAAPR